MATEKQNSEEIVGTDNHIISKDKIGTDKKISRRGLLSKAAIGVPLALTLAHKPAFGAICSLSGFESVTPSGAVGSGQQTGRGCGGFSPGGWKSNGFTEANGGGGPDGNRDQWLAAGINPNPRDSNDAPGTLFFADNAFAGLATSPGVTIGSNETLHDVLINHQNRKLEFHAIANFLNALYFYPNYRLLPQDVLGLYHAYNSTDLTYTSSNGTTVNMSNFYATQNGLQDFFDQYH